MMVVVLLVALVAVALAVRVRAARVEAFVPVGVVNEAAPWLDANDVHRLHFAETGEWVPTLAAAA